MSDADRAQRKLERIISLTLLILFLLPFVARAQGPAPADTANAITLDQVEQPSLLLKTSNPDLFLPATTVSTKIDVHVSGIILRASVKQTFHNSTSQCVEGVYVFPLPEDAAVDAMRMRIGERTIDGVIKEREEARKVYEQAKAEGKRTSLLQQERPNMFTISVASLGADETAEITIEYQQVLRFEGGEFRMRLPLVVAPRYMPGASQQRASSDVARTASTGPAQPARINPSNTPPTVSLQIDIDSGVALREITSLRHKVQTSTIAAGRYSVQLEERVPANRDFELTWKPDLGNEPKAVAITERHAERSYSLLMVVPPAEGGPVVRIPRETIFIIDTSGSMAGESMEQAKEALLLGLAQLQPGDSFNVIEFNSVTNALFNESQTADRSAIEHALQFVRSLHSDGGTEMLDALQTALATKANREVRQVIFITDGQVGNEEELFTFLKQNLHDGRLFTVGIGSAPNSHFMNGAARMGRGTFTYIGSTSEVKDRMTELFSKLENPVLTDIRVESSDPTAAISPALIPDLYLGEPLVVAVQSSGQGTLRVRGRIGARAWETTVTMQPSSEERGIGKLWARRKIEELMDSLSQQADAQTVRASVIALAMEHHLVSSYTSLVAVDTTPAGIDAKSCRSELIPLPSPAGGDTATPGSLPQTATPSALLMVTGSVLLAISLLVRKMF